MEYSCNHLWHRHFYMGKTGHKHKELKCAWGKITLAGHIFLEWSAILIDHLVRFVIIKLASSNYPLGSLIKRDRRGRDRMVFTATYAITYHHKSCEFQPRSGEVYSIQHYVICGFLRLLRFPPPIKLTATIWIKYCWKWGLTPYKWVPCFNQFFLTLMLFDFNLS